jgi:hypothetical protein
VLRPIGPLRAPSKTPPVRAHFAQAKRLVISYNGCDFDCQLVVEMQGTLESFKDVPAEALLLGASKSPAFLKRTLDALERVLPNVRRVELQGLGHAAAVDGGRPERVAQELRRFFL